MKKPRKVGHPSNADFFQELEEANLTFFAIVNKNHPSLTKRGLKVENHKIIKIK